LPLSCFSAIWPSISLNVLGRAAFQIRHKNMLSREGVFSLCILNDAIAAYQIDRADEPNRSGSLSKLATAHISTFASISRERMSAKFPNGLPVWRCLPFRTCGSICFNARERLLKRLAGYFMGLPDRDCEGCCQRAYHGAEGNDSI
jgi:hypothetical protein